jgi:hypothetical protein
MPLCGARHHPYPSRRALIDDGEPSIVRGCYWLVRLLEFNPTSPTEGGHAQHIRERFLPPFSLGFWDGVGSLLIIGLSAHKRPERIGWVLGWTKWTLTSGIRARFRHARLGGFLGGWDVRGCCWLVRLYEFSPTSPTEGGHTQHIREKFIPPFNPGFWDRVGSLLIIGMCAHKHPKCRLSAGLGQMDANIHE